MHEEHDLCVSCTGCRCSYYVPKLGILGLQETVRNVELPLKCSKLTHAEFTQAAHGAHDCHIGLTMSGIVQFCRMVCNKMDPEDE